MSVATKIDEPSQPSGSGARCADTGDPKSIVQRLIGEVMYGGRLEVIDELYTPQLAPAARRWIVPFRESFPGVEMGDRRAPRRPARVCCGGDLVGYGPPPSQVCRAIELSASSRNRRRSRSRSWQPMSDRTWSSASARGGRRSSPNLPTPPRLFARAIPCQNGL
jgi:hypothetical protein